MSGKRKFKIKTNHQTIESFKDNTIDLILSNSQCSVKINESLILNYNELIKTDIEWNKYLYGNKKNTITQTLNDKEIAEKEKEDKLFNKTKYYYKGKEKEEILHILKNNYMKYGSIYKEFHFLYHYYRVLKNGGTLIIVFDIWKITPLKEVMEQIGFKQIRFIECLNTSECREIALLGIKKSKPTFNSKYDNAIYNYSSEDKLALYETLITKHSNEDDIVLDTFLESGFTEIATKNTKRNYKRITIKT